MKKWRNITDIFALASGSDVPGGFSRPSGSEGYYSAVASMVKSHWRDDFFSPATLNIQDSTLKINNRMVKLKEAISVEQNELMLSEEVLSVLGVQVQKNTGGASVSKNGKTVKLTYGEKSMNVNGRRKGMRNAPVVASGAPLIPESALTEEGLGFAVDRSTGNIIITNDFQTMRVVTRIKPGAALPADIQTEQTIAGPDDLYVLQFSTVDEAKMACEMLNASAAVIYAEPDGVVSIAEALPLTPEAVPAATENIRLAGYEHMGWGAGRIGADIYMDHLIANGKQNAAVTVGILDTGLDMEHPYFAGRYVDGYNFVAGNRNPIDDHGHGTHVSGIVIDVAIAMPNVKVMPLKVLDFAGSGAAVNIASGIRWAADNGANVLNASLSGVHYKVTDDAIAYAIGKNVTVTVAAGNNASDTRFACPAHLDEVITVTSITRLDNIASSSNFGASVDVAAPGVEIVSTRRFSGTTNTSRTTSMSGTSMAAPHAAGAVALLLCKNPALTPAFIKNMIRVCADKVHPEFDLRYGYGILNIGNAVIVIISGVPSEPQNFTAIPGNGQVELRWIAPLSDGGSAITGYQVLVDSSSAWVNASSNSGHTFSGLENGMKYTFKARALSDMGEGEEASVSMTPVSDAAIVPSEPQNFTAIPGCRQITLSWSAPASDGGSAITDYQISKDGGSNWVSASSNSGHTFSGLTNGITYEFKVRAGNAIGVGAEATATATPVTTPSEPRDFTAIPADGQVTLSWSVPESDGGSAITGYQVFCSSDAICINVPHAGYTFTGLTNGITYTFKARAFNAVGVGGDISVTATPLEPNTEYPESAHPYAHKLTISSPDNLRTYTHPSAAASLKVTFSGDTKVENSFDKIYVTDAGGANIFGSPFTGTALAGATVIVPGDTMKIYITSDGSINYYGYKVTNIEASKVTAPSAPQNLTATPGNGQVTLNWAAPASDGGSAISGYQVLSDDGSTWVNASSDTGHTFNGLKNGTTYTFKARARNVVGFGEEATISATPMPSILPESAHPYANNLNISSPGNLQAYTYPGAAASLIVTFSGDTKVESSYDKIYITDAGGANINGSPFTGNVLAGKTVIVPGKTVKIYITSDSSINYYGYKVTNIEAVSG